MKHLKLLSIIAVLLLLTACGEQQSEVAVTAITLSDRGVQTDGEGVYTANDIAYYESGKDFTYGEGEKEDEHTAEEAAAHTVVHITKPGTYSITGKLSKGQIAVDLGEDAKDDPNAVVTLILDGADITCEVAPAVIFYNVYECGTGEATKDVDTSAAGANVILKGENTVRGSYVARIYKPGSVELNDAGTEVVDSKKLHKYDAAFYSKMSMNVDGEGTLNINAENEGLDSEMHLTVNGGNINIVSGNDGINTNEDGVSVTTINGGNLNILVPGETGEGDGIDSNGWLVINGGTVTAQACAFSADAGIDSDMGIHINGGTVLATGNMLDRIEDGGQTYAVFNFTGKQNEAITLKDKAGSTVMEHSPVNAYSVLIYSSPNLEGGTYTIWSGDQQLSVQAGRDMGGRPGGMMRPEGFEGMQRPEGAERPERPEGMERPEGAERPEDMTPPEGMEIPEGMEKPENMTPPEGMERPDAQWKPEEPGEASTEFQITPGGNMFRVIML